MSVGHDRAFERRGTTPGTGSVDITPDAGPDVGLVTLTLPQLTRHAQAAPLPVPMQNPRLLPLAELEPEVFERLVAEMVSRQDNRGTQFYGRSGQKQYGLDIVERQKDSARSLYQVKRYDELTKAKIREAVRDYAGPPRHSGFTGAKRRFDPRRFVLVTSAEFDRDTRNVDALAELQDEYAGDLEIEVWGAEAVGRKLREAPYLVFAVFGAAWAQAWCGFDPAPADPAAPRALGLVEDPVLVLGLDALQEEAVACEVSHPLTAARLYGLVARGLAEASFPGHAATMRIRQAKAVHAGGDHDNAFSILFEAALDRIMAGTSVRSLRRDLAAIAPHLNPVQQARLSVLARVADWPEHGSDLATCVPALRELAAAGDPHAPLLCCLVLEQALVDGLFDTASPRPIVGDVGYGQDGVPDVLAELRALAAAAEASDVVLRARLRCAVADAGLTVSSSSSEVQAAYGELIDAGLAGRLLHARGLIASRAAYAFAVAGDSERAIGLWRQSILASSEHEFYGDARAALRALRMLAWEIGLDEQSDLAELVSALPNRRRLLAGAYDPALAAFEAAHHGKLPNALGDTRRYLWESRLAGHLQEEALALSLLGDVLNTGGRQDAAVRAYVLAGNAKASARLARRLPQAVDVGVWATSAMRGRQAAAIQVLGAQAATVRDEGIAEVAQVLLRAADGLWESRSVQPWPELDAVKALASFGVRIPASAVDAILALAQPALQAHTSVSAEIADLVIQTYWAVKSRRHDLAAALALMLRQPQPPHGLWERVRNLPEGARGPLLAVVAALAGENHETAIQVLASWRVTSDPVQRAARRACAALLRRTVGHARQPTVIGNQEKTTVDLLLALLDAEILADVPAAELAPEHAVPDDHHASTAFADDPAGTADDRELDEAAEEEVSDAVDRPPSPDSPDPALPTPPPGRPDQAAHIAAGAPADLAIAVAEQLTAIAEDHHHGAAARARAVSALRRLLRRLPPGLTAQLATQLHAVHRAPRLSQADRWEIDTDTPFTRARFRTGGRHLAGLALVAAAEAFAAARAQGEQVTELDHAFVQEAVASAAQLLRDGDSQTRLLGGLTVSAIASAGPDLSLHALALLFHEDEHIRALGAGIAPADPRMVAVLANDPAPSVRIALARRAAELPQAVREALAADPHVDVRGNVRWTQVTEEEPETG
ncbi:hypothetical protein [Nonomuraea sp. SYSU D8015]|uniref:hypothetical protein n=1 Tax=Nonomuraea sp. SYSU D8015 TaxID=2593644 RepID=UPI00166100AD|nr:hypothetical protein [Nonomuraea sp. SYSU D8015]